MCSYQSYTHFTSVVKLNGESVIRGEMEFDLLSLTDFLLFLNF